MIAVKTEVNRSRLEAFPRLKCGHYPTPLEELEHLNQKLGKGVPRLLIKRDDLTGAFGGNKLRKLDYAIADAINKKADTIVTIAGETSNHARMTAAVCARLGLRCVLVLSRADARLTVPELVPASRSMYEMFGAEQHWVGSLAEREVFALKLTEKLNGSGSRAVYVPLGASTPLGALGYVQAAREMIAQCEKIDARPNYIFHAGTTGGTQAGLIAGFKLFGKWKTEVIAVSPDDAADAISSRVTRIVNGIYRLLETSHNISESEVTVLDNFIGTGYGHRTSESDEALRLSATVEGLILDSTYTGKAMAGMLASIRQGKFTERDTLLFWHTGGQIAPFFAPERN